MGNPAGGDFVTVVKTDTSPLDGDGSGDDQQLPPLQLQQHELQQIAGSLQQHGHHEAIVLNQQHRLVTISHQQQHQGFGKLQLAGGSSAGGPSGGGGGGAAATGGSNTTGAPGSGGGNGTGAPENSDMLKILEPIIVMKTK